MTSDSGVRYNHASHRNLPTRTCQLDQIELSDYLRHKNMNSKIEDPSAPYSGVGTTQREMVSCSVRLITEDDMDSRRTKHANSLSDRLAQDAEEEIRPP